MKIKHAAELPKDAIEFTEALVQPFLAALSNQDVSRDKRDALLPSGVAYLDHGGYQATQIEGAPRLSFGDFIVEWKDGSKEVMSGKDFAERFTAA